MAINSFKFGGSGLHSCPARVASNVNDAEYQEKLARVLEHMGDLYVIGDIFEKIASGNMQSFADGDTWAVTEVHEYPRRRVLDILFVVGDVDNLENLHNSILAFASRVDASLIRAHGRIGWSRFAQNNGWRVVDTVYYRDM